VGRLKTSLGIEIKGVRTGVSSQRGPGDDAAASPANTADRGKRKKMNADAPKDRMEKGEEEEGPAAKRARPEADGGEGDHREA